MPADDAERHRFEQAVAGLRRGDFSALSPLFDDASERPPALDWFARGWFDEVPDALAEALSCAAFNGHVRSVGRLLDRGVDPAGGEGTGLNAVHWAANRGQLEAVRLLVARGAPLESRSSFGGTALRTAVWSALHEPRPDHVAIVEALLAGGARVEEAGYPTGHAAVDAVLERYGAAPRG